MTLTPYVKVNHVAMVTSLSYIRYFLLLNHIIYQCTELKF